MNNGNDIGDRIRKLREENKETQLELAKAVFVKRETVNQWENGARDIKTQHTVAIANHYGVTCDEILRGVKAENVTLSKDFGLTDSAITGLSNLCAYPFSQEAINFLLSSSLFESFLSILISSVQIDEFVKKEGKARSEEWRRLSAILNVKPNDLKQIPSTGIMRIALDIMDDYSAQSNPAARAQANLNTGIFDYFDSMKKRIDARKN